MIIVISGSVGSGKTTIAQKLSEKIKFEVIHLGDMAKEYKIADVPKLQTFDFDINKLLEDIEIKIKAWKKENKNIILESHFAHFINPKLVDILFIINRDLKELKIEYKNRKYNIQKIKDNLEVESFNLCFYEALEEGYTEEKQVFTINNNTNLEDLIKILQNKFIMK